MKEFDKNTKLAIYIGDLAPARRRKIGNKIAKAYEYNPLSVPLHTTWLSINCMAPSMGCSTSNFTKGKEFYEEQGCFIIKLTEDYMDIPKTNSPIIKSNYKS